MLVIVHMGDERGRCLSYADDIVLLSSTKVSLQENLTRLHAAFMQNGLSINAKKTRVLFVVMFGGDKKMKMDTTPYCTVGRVMIPQKSPLDVWTYLGCMYQGAREYANISPSGYQATYRRTPLKPQQWLRLLHDCLLPRYFHRRVIETVSSKTLKDVVAASP